MKHWESTEFNKESRKISKLGKKSWELRLFNNLSSSEFNMWPKKFIYNEYTGLWNYENSGELCDIAVGAVTRKFFGLKKHMEYMLMIKKGVLYQCIFTIHVNRNSKHVHKTEFSDI